ncbi:MAG: S9 family peptidase [Phycisphaerales bacterium]|nr:S9 family peptidase [Phycisphaerales bacterium]
MFFPEVLLTVMLTSPPDVEARPVVTVPHGVRMVDPYSWLREKENPAVITYLDAENEYADSRTAHLEPLRQALYGEMLGRIKEDDSSVPWQANDGWTYYSRTEEGKPYEIICRRQGDDGAEQIILDVNKEAEGLEFYDVTTWETSPDGRRLAWLADRTGYEENDLLVKDLSTGEIIDDSVHNANPFTLSWANDNETIFYARHDEAKRSDRIFRHVTGTPAEQDVLVYHDPDGMYYVSADRSRSGEAILVKTESQLTSEWHAVDPDSPERPPQVIAPRRHGIEYEVERHGDRYFIRTNEDATNFRVVTVPVKTPGSEHWTEFIPHDPDVYVTGIDVFKGHLVVSERRGGYSAIRVVDLETGDQHVIDVPEPVSVISGGTNERFDTTTFRYQYQSPVTPSSTFDYDLVNRERVLRKQREVLGGFNSSDYVTRRIEAVADDGVVVPISVVHHRDVEPDGTNPLLVYGYGAYGSSANPWFSSNRLSLLDRGVVVAIAHIRGGGEMGRHWYDTGKMAQKMNTFTDFVAATEALRDQGWGDPGRIAMQGGSAGGLLIGVVLNIRPDLYRFAHADVPFVDVINTMSDPSIPLTVGEYEEWGNPGEPAAFHRMLAYSPYDNIREMDYPAILVTAGLNDSRVHYWEPAKWTARLRDHKTDDNLLLLRTNMGAGHGGASGRYGRLEETAFEYAVLLDQLGLIKD